MNDSCKYKWFVHFLDTIIKMPEFNVLKVDIYGRQYPIRGESDPEYIQSVARFVDAKMREIDTEASGLPALKVAILAALNITDELFKAQEGQTLSPSLRIEFEDRIHKWIDLLDAELAEVSDVSDAESQLADII